MIFEPTEQKRLENTWNMTYSIKPGMGWTLRWVTWSSLMAEPQMYLFFENPHLRTAMLIPLIEVIKTGKCYLASYMKVSLCVNVPLLAPTQDLIARKGPDWDEFVKFGIVISSHSLHFNVGVKPRMNCQIFEQIEEVKIQWILDFNLFLAPVFSNGRFVFWEWLPCGSKLCLS